MLQILRLQEAGYPFFANDLTLEEWLDLARFKETLNQPQTSMIKKLIG